MTSELLYQVILRLLERYHLPVVDICLSHEYAEEESKQEALMEEEGGKKIY